MSRDKIGLDGSDWFNELRAASTRFSLSMERVRAVTNATPTQLATLRKTALSLGSTTRFSPNQVVESMVQLGCEGLDACQIMESIEKHLSDNSK